MSSNLCRGSLVALSLVMVSACVFGQTKQQSRTLIINGQSGEAAVVKLYGRLYVDLGTLASIANGSVAFEGNRIVKTVPSASPNEAVVVRQHDQLGDSRLSREFTRAGVEEVALQFLTSEFEAVKEWSNNLVEARKSRDAAKYAMSASALQK